MKSVLLLFLLVAIVMLTTLTSLKNGNRRHQIQFDSLKAERVRFIEEIKKSIEGRENLPADSVFKSIQIFKNMPAGRLLAIMDVAFSQSLGVSCIHCHDAKDFSSELKPQKEIAREMWAFAGETRELLKNIKGLQSQNPTINCTTCHRGQVKPALSLN